MIHFNTQLILSSLILFFIQDGVSDAPKDAEELCKEQVTELCDKSTDAMGCFKQLYYNTLYSNVKGCYSQKYFIYFPNHIIFGKIKTVEDYCKNFYEDQATEFLGIRDINFDKKIFFDIEKCIQTLINHFSNDNMKNKIKRLFKTEEIHTFEHIFYYTILNDKNIKQLKEDYEFKIKQIVANSMKSIKKCEDDLLKEYAHCESIINTNEDESIKKIENDKPIKHVNDKGTMNELTESYLQCLIKINENYVQKKQTNKANFTGGINNFKDNFFIKYNEILKKIQEGANLRKIEDKDIENIEIIENDVSLKLNKGKYIENIEKIKSYYDDSIRTTDDVYIMNLTKNIEELIIMLYMIDTFSSINFNGNVLFGPQWCEENTNNSYLICQ